MSDFEGCSSLVGRVVNYEPGLEGHRINTAVLNTGDWDMLNILYIKDLHIRSGYFIPPFGLGYKL